MCIGYRMLSLSYGVRKFEISGIVINNLFNSFLIFYSRKCNIVFIFCL